jgi:hypothetical protein
MTLRTSLFAALTFALALLVSGCTKQQQAQAQSVLNVLDGGCNVVEATINNPIVDIACAVIDGTDVATQRVVVFHVNRQQAVQLGLLRPTAPPSPAPSTSATH